MPLLELEHLIHLNFMLDESICQRSHAPEECFASLAHRRRLAELNVCDGLAFPQNCIERVLDVSAELHVALLLAQGRVPILNNKV